MFNAKTSTPSSISNKNSIQENTSKSHRLNKKRKESINKIIDALVADNLKDDN